MSLRLAPHAPDALRFANHAVSRLRLEPSRRPSGASAQRQPLPLVAASEETNELPDLEARAPESPSRVDPAHGEPAHADVSRDEPHRDCNADMAPDPVAATAQAEAEDLALVRLAAARLAVALREVSLLLRGAQGARQGDALARCTAKGWITLEGDAFAGTQTFRVRHEGYRAAGLRPPPFAF